MQSAAAAIKGPQARSDAQALDPEGCLRQYRKMHHRALIPSRQPIFLPSA